LQWELPINQSSLTRFRQRLGSVRLEKILSLTIAVAVAVKSEAVKVKDLKKVIVDTTVEIDSAFVDRGYKGRGVQDDPLRNHTKIFISGQRRGLTKSLKNQLKRRSAIEPMIEHMKQEGRLGLCRLKGIIGDQINALLTGVGHNLRLILNHVRKLLKLKKLKNFLRQFLFRLLKIYRLRCC
jgi:hypothetical protein